MCPGRAARTERLDVLLVERGLVNTRAKAHALVLAGRVRSGHRRLDKPGVRFPRDIELTIASGPRFVSRGGDKLEGALAGFGIEVSGRSALDVGASTGGFTDVLLKRGAPRVVALDVGRGQLDWGLRNDPRVLAIEGVNARYLRPEDLPFRPSLTVIDVSFISLKRVLPGVIDCLAPGGDVVALVKPQFEVGRGQVGRGGIVRDPEARRRVLVELCAHATRLCWGAIGIRASVLRGADGNQEYFLHLRPGREGLEPEELERQISRLFADPEKSK